MGGASRLNRMDAVRERTSKVPIITEGSQNGDLRFSEAKANPAIAATCVNLTKNLVGSGIFSLPSALQRGSVIPGVGIMCFVGAVQGGSFILIAALCQKLGTRTYRGAWSAAFGQRSGCIVDLCIAINSFFACVAYDSGRRFLAERHGGPFLVARCTKACCHLECHTRHYAAFVTRSKPRTSAVYIYDGIRDHCLGVRVSNQLFRHR